MRRIICAASSGFHKVELCTLSISIFLVYFNNLLEINYWIVLIFNGILNGSFDWWIIILFWFILIFPALPDEGPRITGGRPRYQIGDAVKVNCTAGRSKPATHLNWFINGEPAEATFLKHYEPIVTGREGLEASTLGLEFRVKAKHFRNGDMKLKVSLLFKY